MDEKDFVILRALDETRNVTAAATRLYMTQSALSKRIQTLEHELGTPLMLRSRRGITFTPAGEVALARAQAAEHELELMRREIAEGQGGVRGTLRAGFSVNFARWHLPRLLAAYHDDHPLVHLSVRTGKSRRLYEHLLAGDFDIAVLRGEFAWDGPRHLLAQESVCAIVAHELAGVPLGELPYIRHHTDLAQSQLMDRWLRENGLGGGADEILIDDIDACVDMVRRGLGWSLIPQIGLSGFDGVARPCTFADGEPFVRRMYVLTRREAAELPQVRAFADALEKHHKNP